MYNVLVTGASGQLGSEFKTLTHQEFQFVCLDRAALDICDADAINAVLKAHDIAFIINCAAYTAVDRAEDDVSTAMAINATAVENLARMAKELEIPLIHISTDYVFDGMNYRPYIESDTRNPQSVYGKSKCLGEEAMLRENPSNSMIIRTSWVYGVEGANFVKTMLRLGSERQTLNVVYDQIGSPTYTYDLAHAIVAILPQLSSDGVEIFHYSNEGVLSWYDFAKEIMRMAKRSCEVSPILSAQYPTPAVRPHMSLLGKEKIKEQFNITIPFWKDSLDHCLKRMKERRWKQYF